MSKIEDLSSYLSERLSEKSIKLKIDEFISNGNSSAGKSSREEVFTREFLCPAIADFFYRDFRHKTELSDDQIKSGLGTEGFKHLPSFGFTPARKKKHFFTKNDIIRNEPPGSWYSSNPDKAKSFQACPDFAIRSPLPFNCIGETKLLTKGTSKEAITELYNASRQALFYLGAFAPDYTNALLVMADMTPNQVLKTALEEDLNKSILDRFGDETNIHLCCCFLG
ncbi:MAG: hypothetical protein HQK52_09415 [Oligoflexia bacterium]|nr:hypothetical protein [Oligoflexia bacterium]